jgi:hypothetical protein
LYTACTSFIVIHSSLPQYLGKSSSPNVAQHSSWQSLTLAVGSFVGDFAAKPSTMTTAFVVIVVIVATVVSSIQAQDPHQRVLHQTQPGGTDEPVVCASCVQRNDTCTYSLCSGRAGITCVMHSCSSPLTSENGTELRLAMCYGVYLNADGRLMQGCFTEVASMLPNPPPPPPTEHTCAVQWLPELATWPKCSVWHWRGWQRAIVPHA